MRTAPVRRGFTVQAPREQRAESGGRVTHAGPRGTVVQAGGKASARPPSQEQQRGHGARVRASGSEPERTRPRGRGQEGFVGPWRNLRGNGRHGSILSREEKKPDLRLVRSPLSVTGHSHHHCHSRPTGGVPAEQWEERGRRASGRRGARAATRV